MASGAFEKFSYITKQTKCQANELLNSAFFDKINNSEYNQSNPTTLLFSTTQMADSIIPQDGATNPTPAQDLQINLGETPKVEENTLSKNKESELNLDLDLNLSDAPKNDDRLKEEDQKNNETSKEVTTPENTEPIVENVTEQATVEPKLEEVFAPTPEPEVVAETITPSTTIQSEPITTEASAELNQDMKIIDELNMNEHTGGLAEEAKIEIHPAAEQTAKTFDLDAMLGTPAGNSPDTQGNLRGNEEGVVAEAPITPQPIEQTTEIPQTTPTTETQVPPPAFIIPTTTTSVPVQTIMQTSIPQNKNKGVKALLFTVMFVALGFTTFFILKTMYPIEFGNIFGGNDTQMHASEDIIIETGTVDELSGATDILTGEEMTGTTEDELNNFGELNDLGTMTEENTEENTEQTDLSKLTEYVNKGNELLDQGKSINNTTVIKYGLYISKKATDFLGKIANGEEISNLSGYFAQFDQYITQIEEILSPTIETNTEEVSPTTPPTNAFEEMTDTPNITE